MLARTTCARNVPPDPLPAGQSATTIVQQNREPDGAWGAAAISCYVPVAPPVDARALLAEISKRAPAARIASAGQNQKSLIGVETLFWLDTPPEVDLGTTTLLGATVVLAAEVQSVRWEFGDGEAAVSEGPGRPFRAADHCSTATCPDWFGHTYRNTTGTVTVTATATWVGRFSFNGGPFTPIPGTVASAPVSVPMQVVEARSVLVPNAPR